MRLLVPLLLASVAIAACQDSTDCEVGLEQIEDRCECPAGSHRKAGLQSVTLRASDCEPLNGATDASKFDGHTNSGAKPTGDTRTGAIPPSDAGVSGDLDSDSGKHESEAHASVDGSTSSRDAMPPIDQPTDARTEGARSTGADSTGRGGCDRAAANACGGCTVLPAAKGTPCKAGVGACVSEGTYECMGTDSLACTAVSRNPQPETCDGIDNDCDGTVDEGLNNACGGPCQQPLPEEICDGSDNDCDDMVDEGLLPNLMIDPGFENQADRIGPPWNNFKGGFITNDTHTGAQAVTVVAEPGNETSVTGWNDVFQTISVYPNTTYKVEAWVKTSSNATLGRVGARANPDWMIELAPDWGKKFGALSQYTYQSTLFTTGSATTKADVYVGVGSGADSVSLFVDDVMVSLLQCRR